MVAGISTDSGQVDLSAPVLEAKQSNVDALFVYTNEEESARAPPPDSCFKMPNRTRQDPP